MQLNSKLMPLTAGNELLCLLARTAPAARTVERAQQLLSQGVAWNQLTTQADRHGVTPLIYRSLTGPIPGEIPTEVLEKLRRAFHQNAARNLTRIRELKRVLEVLARSNIPALAHKGPALAQMAYGDPGLRSYGDLDLLVQPQHLREAVRVLRDDGYQPLWELTEAQEALVVRFGYHYNLVRQKPECNLEVHWRLIDPCFAFLLPEQEIWERQVSVRLGADAVPTLSPEDQLVFLCWHGAKHFWSALKLVCDVAELVRNTPGLDWEAVQRIARERRTERVLHLGLVLARELLDAPIPAGVRDQLEQERAMAFLQKEAVRFLFRRDEDQIPVWEMTRFHLRLFETLPQRARYLRAISAPKELDLLAFPLPPALAPLYLLLRPLRLILRPGHPKRTETADADR